MSNVFLPLTLVALLTQLEDQRAEDAARRERLEYMHARAAELTLVGDQSPEPLPLKSEPVLRYTNPERDSGTWDGATFLWLDGSRPVAAVSLGIRAPKNAVFREHTSLSRSPLVCRRGNGVVWSPKVGGVEPQAVPDAPPPSDTQTGRLIQMRSLARRFSGSCTLKEETTQLRVLPQPLYRYADDKQGVMDGALFAMVVSNDPELFLILEAKENENSRKPEWNFALARMSSLKLQVSLDEKEVWSVPGYYTIPAAERQAGPYIESFQGTFASAEADQR
jgi:hypothetical protein